MRRRELVWAGVAMLLAIGALLVWGREAASWRPKQVANVPGEVLSMSPDGNYLTVKNG